MLTTFSGSNRKTDVRTAFSLSPQISRSYGINTCVLILLQTQSGIFKLLKPQSFNYLTFEARRITESLRSCMDPIFTNFTTSCSNDSVAVEIAASVPASTIPNEVIFLTLLNEEISGILASEHLN